MLKFHGWFSIFLCISIQTTNVRFDMLQQYPSYLVQCIIFFSLKNDYRQLLIKPLIWFILHHIILVILTRVCTLEHFLVRISDEAPTLPPERYRISLALVRSFGHVLHLIRAILRSFQISYFSTDLMSFCCFSFDLFVLARRVQWSLVVDPLHGIAFLMSPSYYFPLFFRLPNLPTQYFCTTASNESIALVAYRPQRTPLPGQGLEELPSGQSHNLLK